jgi:hypothetical protein
MTRKILPFAKTVKVAFALLALMVASPAMAVGFASPSGNIACYVDLDAGNSVIDAPLVCLIFDAEWDNPPDYGDDDPTCDLDRTRTIILPSVGEASVRWTCHGDVFWPAPLGHISYGSQWSLFNFNCDMGRDGVRCDNSGDGGFRLSRARRQLD